MDGPINLPAGADAAQIAAEVARLELLANGDEVRFKIAERLCELSGAHLRCTRCGFEDPLNVERSLYYIAHGWPRHCGEQMEIHTREVAAR